jgi:hypothetical protein
MRPAGAIARGGTRRTIIVTVFGAEHPEPQYMRVAVDAARDVLRQYPDALSLCHRRSRSRFRRRVAHHASRFTRQAAQGGKCALRRLLRARNMDEAV